MRWKKLSRLFIYRQEQPFRSRKIIIKLRWFTPLWYIVIALKATSSYLKSIKSITVTDNNKIDYIIALLSPGIFFCFFQLHFIPPLLEKWKTFLSSSLGVIKVFSHSRDWLWGRFSGLFQEEIFRKIIQKRWCKTQICRPGERKLKGCEKLFLVSSDETVGQDEI